MNVPHGLDFYDGSFWVIDGADRLVQRIDPEIGSRAGDLGVRTERSGSARHVRPRQPRVLHRRGPRRRPQAERGHEAADDLQIPADADVDRLRARLRWFVVSKSLATSLTTDAPTIPIARLASSPPIDRKQRRMTAAARWSPRSFCGTALAHSPGCSDTAASRRGTARTRCPTIV